MRKALSLVGATLLFAGPALAADLGGPPVYKAPPLMPIFSWTGWYIGGNIGYGWGETTNPVVTSDLFTFLPGAFPNLKPKGVIGGGQIGYDWQVHPNWVVGLVADFQSADINASGTNLVSNGLAVTNASLFEKLDSLGTVRARLGFAANNWLFYGSAGLAYGNVKSAIDFLDGVFDASRSETRAGWAAGGGANYAFTPNWIVGVDYIHYDLGRTSVTAATVDPVLGTINITASQNVAGDIVRGVINYKF
jgi:outer membrane immunogenic protein